MEILISLRSGFVTGVIALLIYLCTLRKQGWDNIEKRFFEATKRIGWNAESFKRLFKDIKKGLKEDERAISEGNLKNFRVPNREQFINLIKELNREKIINYLLLIFFTIVLLVIILILR